MSKNARYDLAVANLRVAPVSSTGGNLCFADPHSDPASLLIAVGASMLYQGTAQSSGGTPLQHGPGPVVRPRVPRRASADTWNADTCNPGTKSSGTGACGSDPRPRGAGWRGADRPGHPDHFRHLARAFFPRTQRGLSVARTNV